MDGRSRTEETNPAPRRVEDQEVPRGQVARDSGSLVPRASTRRARRAGAGERLVLLLGFVSAVAYAVAAKRKLKTLVATPDPQPWNERQLETMLQLESCYNQHPQWVVETPSGVRICSFCDTEESAESWPELESYLLEKNKWY